MGDRETGTLVYLAGDRDVEFKEFDLPTPERGAVLTRVEQANVCGSDLHTWGGNHPQRTTGRMGHEGVCEIETLGEGVETDYAGRPVGPGDLVAPVYFIPCQQCPTCQEGAVELCDNLTDHTVGSPTEWPHFTGMFATHYYIHPTQYFYKIPAAVDPAIAASANCALSQTLYGLDRVGLSHSDTVVIQGAGGLGLFTLAIATESGAETIVIEGVDRRLDRAAAFGADHLIDFRAVASPDERAAAVEEITGAGADVAVEVTGVPDAYAEGPRYLRKAGTYLVMGNVTPGRTVPVDPGGLTRRGVDVLTALHYEPWYLNKALEFLEDTRNRYPYDELVDEEYPLADVETALEDSEKRRMTRATLTPCNPDARRRA